MESIYDALYKSQWLGPYEAWIVERGWPSPRGLLLGLGSALCALALLSLPLTLSIGAVLVGQIVVFMYYVFMRFVIKPKSIQYTPPPNSTLLHDLWGHIAAPGSFVMLFLYLSLTWMFRIMPDSYYNLEAPINWLHVLAQFLVVDFFTFSAHMLEHTFPEYYKRSHKFHHVFLRPKLFNAFNGSIPDTFSLIIVPLVLTAQICRFVNQQSYLVFGTLYASIFTLIHAEFVHPWDPLFRILGIGTAWDHNIHHALFVYNYGHFFMYWDWMWGTYKDPRTVKQLRVSGLQDDIAQPESDKTE